MARRLKNNADRFRAMRGMIRAEKHVTCDPYANPQGEHNHVCAARIVPDAVALHWMPAGFVLRHIYAAAEFAFRDESFRPTAMQRLRWKLAMRRSAASPGDYDLPLCDVE